MAEVGKQKDESIVVGSVTSILVYSAQMYWNRASLNPTFFKLSQGLVRSHFFLILTVSLLEYVIADKIRIYEVLARMVLS